MKNKFLPKVVACGLTAMLTVGLAGTAFADYNPCWTNPENPVDVTTDTDANGNAYSSEITAAGHRAAQTLVEIVGLNNKAGQNMAGNKDGIVDGDADQLDPEYNYFGSSKDTVSETGEHKAMYDTALEAADNCKILGVFGSDLNSNPDPYYYNYYYDCYALTNNMERVANNQKVLMINSSLSPNLADTINSTDYDFTGGVSCSVYSKADILIGANAATKGTKQTYVDYITDLWNSSDLYDDYNPIVFAYKYTDVYQEGESLQRLADTMNNIDTLNGSVDTEKDSSNVGTIGRYGDPMITANDYQLYVKGLSAYVASKIDTKKTVVVIDPASCTTGQKGDEQMPDAGWFRAYDNTTKDGLATKTRGAEAVENVTENLLQTYKNDSDKVYNFTATSDGNAYAITEDVVKEADVIIIQGAQSKIDVFTEDEFKAYMEENFGWTNEDFASKTIIAENPQCVYGMTCNSSESAMAYGFYMGYIYPEILNPVDACAFFYNTCLHIEDEDAIEAFMQSNVTPYVTAIGATLSKDWYKTIKSDINKGVEYFNTLEADAQKDFLFVSRVASGSDVNTGIFTSYNEKTINSVLDLNISKWNNPTGAAIPGGTCSAASVKRGSIAGVALTNDEIAAIEYTYESADESIATVSADGTITGVAEGKTTVYVTAKLGEVEYVYEEAVSIGYADLSYTDPSGEETTISSDVILPLLENAEEKDGYKLIALEDLLDAAGLEMPECSVKFLASDGFSATLKVADGLCICTNDGGASYRSYDKTVAQWNNTAVSGVAYITGINHNLTPENNYTCDNTTNTGDCGYAADLEEEIKDLEAALKDANETIDELKEEITDAQEAIEDNEEEIAKLKEELEDAKEESEELKDEIANIYNILDFMNAKATLSTTKATYTGKAITPTVDVVLQSGVALEGDADYTVEYSNNVNAGTATVTIIPKGAYADSYVKELTFTIAKAAQTLKVTPASKTVKPGKSFNLKTTGNQGKVTYKKTSGNSKITVSSTGKVTVKKGLKSGKTYKIKVKVTAKATANYAAKSITKTITIKVK